MRQQFLCLVAAVMILAAVSAAYAAGGIPVKTATSTESGNAHSQPRLTPETPSIAAANIGVPPYEINPQAREAFVGLNIYLDDSKVMHQPTGLAIRQDDEVCVGDKLTATVGVKGEYFMKGGPTDSPPITIVDDINEVIRQINAGTYRTRVQEFGVCSWQTKKEAQTGPQRCIVDGAVICSAGCGLSSEGVSDLGNNVFEVSKAGKINFDVQCTPKCIVFVDRKARLYMPPQYRNTNEQSLISQYGAQLDGAYGYLGVQKTSIPGYKDPIFDSGISKTFRIEALSTGKSSVEVKKIAHPQSLDGVSRIVLQNTGTTDVNLDSFDLGIAGVKIIYRPSTLSPGQEEDILVSVEPKTRGSVKANLAYSAQEKQCQSQKSYSTNFIVGVVTDSGWTSACNANSQCSTGLCCAGACRDSSKGVCEDIDGDGQADTWVSG